MTEIILTPKEIVSFLVSLLKLLAEAIGWVCQQKKKRIPVPIPLAYAKGIDPRDGGCFASGLDRGRADAEILIGVLRLMKTRDPRRTASGRR